MQVGRETPRIIRFTYRQEKGDPGYGSCLWADFDFDTENYNLSIASDCGYYGYGWPVTKNESFLKMMSRIGDDYLLGKLCEESVVDWELTKEQLIDALDDMDLVEYQKNVGIKRLEDLADDYDMESDIGAATRLIEEWNEEYFQLSDVWEYVRTDYTGNQKKLRRSFGNTFNRQSGLLSRKHVHSTVALTMTRSSAAERPTDLTTRTTRKATWMNTADAENCKLCPQYRLRETKKDTEAAR